MAKKVIQVPIDPELLAALDELSRKQGRARSELIRRACQHYLREVEIEEMDRRYREGYEAMPEEPEMAEALAALASQVLSMEPW